MACSLSEDLRFHLISAVEAGSSCRAAAARFGVGASSAVRWVRAWRASGCVAAKRQGGDRRSVCAEQCLAISRPSRYNLQKTAHAAEHERPDVAAKHAAWRRAQPDLAAEHLLFIDETGATTKVACLRGWANVARAVSPPCPTGTGNPRPSQARCGWAA